MEAQVVPRPICLICWHQLYPADTSTHFSHPVPYPEHCLLCKRPTDAGLYIAYQVIKKPDRRGSTSRG